MSEIDDDMIERPLKTEDNKTPKKITMELIFKKLEEINNKLDTLNKPKYSNSSNNSNDTYKNKRNVYLNKLNDGSIKMPKPDTLEYYKVVYDSDTKTYS